MRVKSLGHQLTLLQNSINSIPTPSSRTHPSAPNPPFPPNRIPVSSMSANNTMRDDTGSILQSVPAIPKIPAHTQAQSASSASSTRQDSSLNSPGSRLESSSTNGELELLLCFDSNGKHIDRKRLWKKNGSEYKQCGTLHKVAEEVRKLRYTSLKYMVISIGTNDLDEKDHEQVLGELDTLLNDIRRRFAGVKFVINELIPRNDPRNEEVVKFNTVLQDFAAQPDITIASQHNISDVSMLHDRKHLLESTVPIYAKNIINAMLKAFGISDKRELFRIPGNTHTYHDSQTNNIQNRFRKIAGYNGDSYPTSSFNTRSFHRGSNGSTNNESVIRSAIMQFGDVLVRCIQR